MKKQTRKLSLNRETVHTLERESLHEAAGGTNITCFVSCHLGCGPAPSGKTEL
ncbi:MAG TPA: class I lanthipeptide [Thermoanaerobaculia bacterium]|nr:class I lanthipeptide [Thermoanaerobaculia bacterium]